MGFKRVFISRTPAEWQIIESRLKEMGKSELSHYLRSNIFKLKEDLEKRGICIPAKEQKEKQPSIPVEMYKELETIASNMKTSVASLVSDYLITPLLHPSASAHQDSF